LAGKSFKEQRGGGKEGASGQAGGWALATAVSPGLREGGHPQATLQNVIPNINPPGKKPCVLKLCLPILALEN